MGRFGEGIQLKEEEESEEDLADSKRRMEEFYKTMNARYQMHKMTRRRKKILIIFFLDSSYIQQGKMKSKAKKYLEDEIRKNSHHHYWVPEDIMFIKGKPLKKALKFLEVKNLRKMKDLKKSQYRQFSGGSKPSIQPLRVKRDLFDLEIRGRAIEDISLPQDNQTYETEEEFQKKFNNYLSNLPKMKEEDSEEHQLDRKQPEDSKSQKTYNLTEKQKNHLSKYRSGANFEIIEDEGSDESYDLDNLPNLKAGLGDTRYSKASANTTSTRPQTAINRIGSMKRPISSHPMIKEEI